MKGDARGRAHAHKRVHPSKTSKSHVKHRCCSGWVRAAFCVWMVIRRLYQTAAAGLKVPQRTNRGSRPKRELLLSTRFFIEPRLPDYDSLNREQTDVVPASVLTQRLCKSAITALCCCFSLLYRPWISLFSVCLRST